MNCAEVMEWMHRYLDHDLSQEEMVEMFRHIDDCPSCADIFDRLNFLSQQLEKLPDVKAPFSLVDSILPRLDELDRDVREPGRASSDEQVIVPLTRKSTHGKPAKGTSIATRTGIGAVAAAIILGIAIFNMPEKMPGADVDRLMDKAADTAVSTNNARMESGAANSTDGGAAPNSDSGQEFSAMDAALPDDGDDDSAANAEPTSKPEVASKDNPGSAPAASHAPKMDKKTTPPKNKKTIVPPTSDSITREGDGSNANQKGQGTDTQGSGDATGDSAPLEGSTLPAEEDEAAGMRGILPSASAFAIHSALSTWTSPDGRYSAALAGEQLVIYSIPAGGSEEDKQSVTSLPLEGIWVSGEWSPDSLQFTYVIEQNAVNVEKVYKVKAVDSSPSPSTEMPAATPASTPAASESAK